MNKFKNIYTKLGHVKTNIILENMKRSLLILMSLLVLGITGMAQIITPVKWKFSVVQEPSKDEATIVLKAIIDKGFHVYSQFVEGDPIPTTFIFNPSKDYALVGKTTESKPEEKFDPNFNVVLKFFSDQAVFKQKIKIKSEKDFHIKGTLNYLSCNDKMCLPPEDVEFDVTVKGVKIEAATEIAVDTATTAAPTVDSDVDSMSGIDRNASVIEPSTKPSESEKPKSIWGIFIAGFLGGFLALLTPCVFPMIPLTVSFFTKRSGSRGKGIFNALVYGSSIIAIYIGLGFGVTKLLGADALNDLASNVIFNMIFFVMLIVFGASFLGAFEITLPNSWINKSDQQSEKGGLIGIFFMAFTLALVSFSCTGPIIGTLLVEAAVGGSYAGPLMGMFGFSLALALPFGLFAAFPSLLNSLPKSGGWLNSVKVVLGFLELALSLKFLSNVDLAYHWGILSRETFLCLWIVIFGLLGLYLLGKLKFSHDSELKYISIPRLMLAIISLSFSIYMIPGLWGAPLKAISAFSPPQATQDFDLSRASFAPSAGHDDLSAPKKHAGTFHCPHNLNCFFDYDEAMIYAKKVNKPLFIDFTGWSCVNCRKMEASVWSDPEVLKRLMNDYVMVSLYVDDKTTLPESEQYVSKFSGKKIKTLGNKWSDLQASRFNTNSQPYYVILNQEEKLLTSPHAFDLDIKAYVEFLENGSKAFQAK